MKFKPTLDFAQELDKNDSLCNYRNMFHIPLLENGSECIYLSGNSLGLQPKCTADFINQELKDWADFGVEGHFNANNPWMPYHEFLTESYSRILGAKNSEVVAMNTLTVNLHLMLVSFYRPSRSRHKIIIEADAFPSDIYAVESQIKFHGLCPKQSLIKLTPRKGEVTIRTEDIINIIEEQGSEVALLMLGGVNYYTGQVFDFEKITNKAHQKNIKVGFDLAHAVGNIILKMHDWQVDFAVWCSYKYLNSGPGSVGGVFVHEKHHNTNLLRFAGWWGHDKDNRFEMPDTFMPINSAEGWQLSNPPILSMAAIRSSLTIFDEVGMEALVMKSKMLTGFLDYLLGTIKSKNVEVITPEERGCQLSIRVNNSDKRLFQSLTSAGVVADWREPDVIRVAPVPLYNSYKDVFMFYKILKKLL